MSFRLELERIIKQQERVLVVGLGISGIESAAFCRRLGIAVTCVEGLSAEEYLSRGKYSSRLDELKAAGVEIYFGINGENVVPLLDKVSLSVLSPGVSHESAIYGALKRRGIKLITEFELGIELYRDLKNAKAVVVTGSNGKSTTVSLIHHLLSQAGRDSVLCGNVGVPVVSGLSASILNGGETAAEPVLVVEASSYQLEACSVLKPHIGAVLNLSDNHLERHGTMARYAAAKGKIFACQDSSDMALLNADDSLVSAYAPKLKGRVLYFGSRVGAGRRQEGAFFDYRLSEKVDRLIIRLDSEVEEYNLLGAPLLGVHNRYNMAAAILTARLLEVPSALIVSGVQSFQPLEHRLEFVKSSHPAFLINDSKSTTVAASVAALDCILEAFPGKKITLLIGGLVKAGSWAPLLERLKGRAGYVQDVICFGKDGHLLANHCRAFGVPCQVAGALSEAVDSALAGKGADDVVLLSPGCASFDEFTDFEERGRAFKDYVRRVAP